MPKIQRKIPLDIAIISNNDKVIYNTKRKTVISLIREAVTILYEKEEMPALKIEAAMFKLSKNKSLKPFLGRLVVPKGENKYESTKYLQIKDNKRNNNLLPLTYLEQSIVDSVCIIHRIGTDRIRDRNKSREMTDARYQIFQILVNLCGYKLVDVGLKFNLNHATVISALKNHRSFLYFDKKYTRSYIQSLLHLLNKNIDNSLENEIKKELRDPKIKEFIPQETYEKVNSNS
jgi:hypothetical protein